MPETLSRHPVPLSRVTIAPYSGFSIELSFAEDRAEVAVSGELDIATQPFLRSVLRPVLEHGCPARCNLGGLTFIDASGIRVLSETATELATRGQRLVLEDAPPSLHRLLAITGLEGRFELEYSPTARGESSAGASERRPNPPVPPDLGPVLGVTETEARREAALGGCQLTFSGLSEKAW